ncbi:hypothetical protein M5D96_005743 [Drosophila gunungcola]|uniref:NTF2 domain-containing protein n=1 Tax=Drosophila gunungcola TaxID=103775 RepID=A0A9P9YQX4_9MUSC|nr:hypothetical protein M5D96_005743 [Drosophila gunungcola]
MRILGSSKSCATGNRLSVTFKAHPNSQPQLNDLRKNLNDKIRFREYVKNIIGNEEQMGSVLDTISSTQEEERLATVTGWSTVNIANCAGVSNSSIYLALKWVLMPIKVEIFNFKRSGPEDKMARGQFLVDNLLCANRLKRLQQEVAILYTCQKIEVSVTPGLPKSVMNAQILEGFSTAVKTAIKVRYDLATRTLDLSRFHACPELGKLFCPLHVVNLLQSVLALSSQLFPQMAGIVLSNNYLCSLKAFAGVSNSLASLERLDISANRIKDLGELNYLGNLKLKTLFVAGNGLAKLKLGDIQEVLPQLQNVHGCVYSEEKEEVIANLPVYQRLQDSGTKGMQLCINFISSFYNSFDEPEKRSQLKDYYHEQAMFSLSLPVQLDHVYAYKLYNRNQRRQQSSFAHNAKLQVGSASLLLALSRLPLMQTDHQNAGLDIHVFNANLRIFTLSGYFKEITSDGWERRHFQRTFVLRLINSPGWLITNDMLCITSIKSEQREPVKFQPNTDTSAIQNISLMDAKMDLLPDESLDEMPPLVAIGPLNTNQADLLDQVIEDTLMSDEDAFDLVIDEDTFTRPKRRNLDFSQNGAANDSAVGTGAVSGTPAMLQLEIGGLVTTKMHNSFLQDTSPPSSICSSMNTERMNNSLITSADFTNLNFLQSTIGLEQDPSLTTTLTNQTTDNMGIGGGLGGYTLSDMIRDRKALESLTLCEDDGTLIKDSHIGQIDEISLTLSKTASGCSTMDNSTDSMSIPLAAERTVPAVMPVVCPALQRTMILGEEMIGDTTFNLVDSLTTSVLQSESESLPVDGNATFKRPNAGIAAADETQLVAGRQMNTTFTDTGCNTPEGRCETPENIDRKLALLTMESSTPLTTNIRSHCYHNNNNNNNNKQGYTPTLKGRGDMNLSPIVGATPQKPTGAAPGRLNNTFEPATKTAPFNGEKFVLDTMELLEQIEQPLDGTYSLQMSEQHKQMQCVMDLAEAEVEMLAQQGDEEQFEHMLAELGKVNTLNKEQLKMQKSLETIKRRFHRDEPEPEEREEVQQAQQPATEKVDTPVLNQSHSSSNSSGGGGSGSGERLLSRRSRLYDDVNLSAMHASNASSASANSASFIVQRRDGHQVEQSLPEPDPEPAEEPPKSQMAAETDPSSYKLPERRERDRDRFKTIKISKEMRLQQEIIVPCIDDEPQQLEEVVQLEQEEEEQSQRQGSPPGRLSRRDQNTVFNNNKAESSASNYLTYKKPKEKSLLQRRPLQQEAPPPAEPAPASTLPQPRSLSRPRYISGLQKFTTVSKATSAGAGLNATPAASVPATVTMPATAGGELKSPMGIKSKSFHNLSSTMSGIGAGTLPRPSLGGGGLRRPGAQPSKLMGGLREPTQAQEDDSAVFKVPKLVSGLRAPGLAGGKRVGTNGLARPSSGYYSLSVKTATEAETPESLSSASSRGSLYGHKDSGRPVNGGNVPQQSFDMQALTSKLTQVTTGSTGIPKPSGLRPPSQMKRSGLPRPSSIVRR